MLKAKRYSQAKLVKAFREEVRLWKLTHDEDILLRVFMVCLSERMKGRDPADLTQPAKQ